MAKRTEVRDRIVLTLAIVGVLASHLLWILANEVPLSPDAYAFLARLLQFHDGFPWRDTGLAEAIRELSHGGRPPLLQLLTLPFLRLFGRSETALLLVNLPIVAWLMGATFKLGRAAYGSTAGLLAAVFVACYPPLIHLAHSYRPHLATAACAATALWLLVELSEDRSPRRALAFGVCLGVGMLLHPTFFWALAAPTAVFATALVLTGGDPARPASWRRVPHWLGAKLREPLVTRGLLPGAAAAIAMAVPWYALFGERIIRLQQRLASPKLEALRGYRYTAIGFPEIDPSPAWYALSSPGALSRSAVLLLVAGAALCLWRKRGATTAILLVTVAGAFIALSAQSTLAWLYPGPALPAVATLAAGGIAAIRHPATRRTVAGAAAIAAVIAFIHVSWGGPAPLAAVARLDGAAEWNSQRCRFSHGYCSSPPATGEWPTDQVLAAILDDPGCQEEKPCSLLVVYGANMGKTLFEFRRSLSWPHRELVIRSQLRAQWGSTFPFRTLLTSDYLFFADLPPRPGHRATYIDALLTLLRSPPGPFERSHESVLSVELPRGVDGHLLRRTAPLTTAEVRAVLDSLPVPPHVTGEGLALLARRLAAEGDYEGVGEVLQRAERAGVGQPFLGRISRQTRRGPDGNRRSRSPG